MRRNAARAIAARARLATIRVQKSQKRRRLRNVRIFNNHYLITPNAAPPIRKVPHQIPRKGGWPTGALTRPWIFRSAIDNDKVVPKPVHF
jgi:hypothetical protein